MARQSTSARRLSSSLLRSSKLALIQDSYLGWAIAPKRGWPLYDALPDSRNDSGLRLPSGPLYILSERISTRRPSRRQRSARDRA
ncbi:hypothetical protein PsYK624_067850 [Phanerochaete sordida]|uniref:Uncharacterized protein n=1 Tax=Phanerochaete sordida TaxID=48140 RepID=A0A9P3LCM5_9APHY|nr:hypothetical protein PsYK624_067850 [Phanerochaete sordida]